MSKANIVIVEDDAVLAVDLKSRLENMDYNVSAMVPSGEEAVVKIKQISPDLVLMDIMLKGKMDGIETAGNIRSKLNIPIVYLTAFAQEEILERAKISEPFGYIIKPFQDRELKSTVEIALYKHSMEKRLKENETILRQSQKMEAIGVLAGGIAHDFNNILSPIIGYVEIMMDEIQEDSQYQHYLKEVFDAAMRASELVKQILTFSRQAEKEIKPLQMTVIIKEVLKLIRASIPSTIKIEKKIDNNCSMVMADPTQIHQITMNLITNAFHAMEENGGKLCVELAEVNLSISDLGNFDLNPGLYICLSVSDTGIGIDKANIDRIFDPYFTTKEIKKGTGLGLSVVHGIVTSYGGNIKVYSEPGKGSIFNVYIPGIETATGINEKKDFTQIQGGYEHILLVDDEEQISRMEKQLLESLGYQVTIRTSSIDALKVFQSTPDKFDLVITDMTMPNMTGERLAIKIKEIRNEIPVIICTGFSEKISNEKALALGINGFLMKPITKRDLAEKIRKILDD